MRYLTLVAVILCVALSGCGKRQWTGQANSKQATYKNMTIDRASGQSSEDNLKSLTIALLMYSQDYDETMPPMTDAATAQNLLSSYTKDPALWVDPRNQQAYGINPTLAGRAISTITSHDQIAVFYETNPRPDGTRAVAFLDGHVALLQDPQWQQAKQLSGIP